MIFDMTATSTCAESLTQLQLAWAFSKSLAFVRAKSSEKVASGSLDSHPRGIGRKHTSSVTQNDPRDGERHSTQVAIMRLMLGGRCAKRGDFTLHMMHLHSRHDNCDVARPCPQVSRVAPLRREVQQPPTKSSFSKTKN
jgi:hypothetical protein